MIDRETFEAARERGGGPADDRNERVDELLDWPQLGYGEGEPLAADEYGFYPSHWTELTDPKWVDTLTELFAHPLVRGYDDAVNELFAGYGDRHLRGKWREGLQSASDAASVDAQSLFDQGDANDVGGSKNALAELAENFPDRAVRQDNPLCLSHLYVEKGLSVAEIADVFETEVTAIRDVLSETRLVAGSGDRPDGTNADDLLVNVPSGDGGGPSEPSDHGGATIDVSDF